VNSELPEAVLLDRDGTINVKADEGDYITEPSRLELLSGAGEAIRMLNERSVPVAVVSNQRGVALGRMTEDDVDSVHARLAELLAPHGAHIDAIFYCPHAAGVCSCRKPGTLMLEQARDQFGLSSLDHTVMIGDAISDVQAGLKAGARVIRIAAPDQSSDGVPVAPSLLAAVQELLAGTSSPVG
jgi:D-glycero-D-manno-heptose 1,7-bisphosphate phosphatase